MVKETFPNWVHPWLIINEATERFSSFFFFFWFNLLDDYHCITFSLQITNLPHTAAFGSRQVANCIPVSLLVSHKVLTTHHEWYFLLFQHVFQGFYPCFCTQSVGVVLWVTRKPAARERCKSLHQDFIPRVNTRCKLNHMVLTSSFPSNSKCTRFSPRVNTRG